MACLSLSLLGPFEAALDGALVSGFVSNKARALLVYLAVESERPHRRDSLAALLWPDWPDASARSNLRNALANLRTVIGDREADPSYLLISRDTIQFNPTGDHSLDVAVFQAAAEDQTSEPARLEQALALYRGPFLDGFSVDDSAAFEDWTLRTRETLDRLALSALERLAEVHERAGQIERAIEAARRQAALAPWQESAHRGLMRLLALDGQRSAALAQYEACRRALREELGVEPSAETTRLYAEVREGRIGPSAAPCGPKPEQQDRPQHNLPPQATPFVGRETQLAEICALLARPEVRLLTLTGVGGTGKTRLALQVAAGVLDDYTDGVYWVALAPLRDPALVVPTIAAALGVRESGETPLLEALKYSLRDQERLLVIDNFEQVLDASPAVGELLGAAPRLKVLATSRAPLHLYLEHEYAVPPMEVPYPRELPSLERLVRADAVSLFLQRAEHVRPGFALDEENAAAVAEICARLDGLPLAVELAASRTKYFAPQAMLAHIGEHQGDRLQFLTGGPRDAPARQRTLRAAIEWSYDLLDTQEQHLFRQLAVFSGGCTLQAVKAVCANDSSSVAHTYVGRPSSIDLLESLVDQSLLQVSRSSPPRFTMLETVREYATERLEESGEAEAVRDRHAAHYAGALEDWGEDLIGPRQLEALAEIEADLDNARAAWKWAAERAQADWLDRALEGLCTFYDWRGRYEEGKAACGRAADALDNSVSPASAGAETAAARDRLWVRVLAGILTWQAAFDHELNQGASADRCLERALAILDDPALEGAEEERAFVLLGMSERAWTKSLEQCKNLAERSLALYRTLDDERGVAGATFRLATIAWRLGAFERAKEWCEECLTFYRKHADQKGTVRPLLGLSVSEANLGQVEQAERLAQECVEVAQRVGDVRLIRGSTSFLATALCNGGRFAAALSLEEQILALCRDQGHRTAEINALRFLGVYQRHLGQYDKAWASVQAALNYEPEFQRQAAQCCTELGRLALVEKAYDEAQAWLQRSVADWERIGRDWMLGETWGTLAYVALGLDQPARARHYLVSALQMAAETRYLNTALQSLPAAALLLIDGGEIERAVELYALDVSHPYAAHSKWIDDVGGKQIAAAAEALPPEVVVAAQERGCARDLWATVEELLEELAD